MLPRGNGASAWTGLRAPRAVPLGLGHFSSWTAGEAPSPAGSVRTGPEQGKGSLGPCSQVLLRNWAGGRAQGSMPRVMKAGGLRGRGGGGGLRPRSGGAEAQEWEGPSQVSRGVSGSFSPWSMAASALPHRG